jgi:hypothetical protein
MKSPSRRSCSLPGRWVPLTRSRPAGASRRCRWERSSCGSPDAAGCVGGRRGRRRNLLLVVGGTGAETNPGQLSPLPSARPPRPRRARSGSRPFRGVHSASAGSIAGARGAAAASRALRRREAGRRDDDVARVGGQPLQRFSVPGGGEESRRLRLREHLIGTLPPGVLSSSPIMSLESVCAPNRPAHFRNDRRAASDCACEPSASSEPVTCARQAASISPVTSASVATSSASRARPLHVARRRGACAVSRACRGRRRARGARGSPRPATRGGSERARSCFLQSCLSDTPSRRGLPRTHHCTPNALFQRFDSARRLSRFPGRRTAPARRSRAPRAASRRSCERPARASTVPLAYRRSATRQETERALSRGPAPISRPWPANRC